MATVDWKSDCSGEEQEQCGSTRDDVIQSENNAKKYSTKGTVSPGYPHHSSSLNSFQAS